MVLEVILVPIVLPVSRRKQGQDLQDMSRTIRSITRMIRSSSKTTFKEVLKSSKKV